MHFKFLFLLWSVMGHFGFALEYNIINEITAVIDQLPKGEMPDDKYTAIKEKLIELRGSVRGIIPKRYELVREIVNLEINYGNVARAIKVGDWIVEVEQYVFPRWLIDAPISRYYKWMIALLTIKTKFFEDLRSSLLEKNIENEKFAKVIDEIHYDLSRSFAHSLPGIDRPKSENLDTFCKFFSEDFSSQFVCKIVASQWPQFTDSPKLTSTVAPADFSTKFFIFVTNVAKSNGKTIKKMFHDFRTKIEDTVARSAIKYIIIHSTYMPGIDAHHTIHTHEEKIHLPGMFFHIGLKLDLEDVLTNREWDANFDKYIQLKTDIETEIKPPQQNDYVVTISDDYVLTATLPPSSTEQATKSTANEN